MTDYSFIRLKPTFAEALQIGDPSVSEINYHDLIIIHPAEATVQTSNVPTPGIAFDEDYQVLVIDCQETTLADITSKVAIEEFTASNGIPQIRFEFAYLNVDFYNKPVFLKLIKTTGSDVWYSNPILITSERERETTRFDYQTSGVFKGVDQGGFMQSIRLRCYFDRYADETVSKDYKQFSGREITAESDIYEKSVYKFPYINNITRRAAAIMLSNSRIYIDGQRCTNKPTIETGDRLGNSNLYETEFTAAINPDDTFDWDLQLTPPFALVEFTPSGTYTLDNLPTTLTATFNRTITTSTGTITLYNASGDTVIASFDQSDFVAFGTGFSISILGLILANGSYYVKISDGLIISGLETYAGIDDKTTWAFTVSEGDWDGDDWDNEDWFTG